MKKIIFVCTGNYYRSRFAEAWFNFSKGQDVDDWHACSRGLMTECAPTSISPHTKDRIEKLNIPKECYQPLPVSLTLEDLESADMVIAMLTEEHYPMMREKFGEWADRIRYWDVHDLDQWTPSQTLPAIEIQVGLLVAELAAA
jgi:protein-tyrosine phosphatase